ncbi:F-box protein At5g07610-like [Triticum aestivum]|uniref:F-box protein At5g07610-like n=1 Tax=Triticum aestivum TaxID=4565 RepID=UPI001D01FB88|nr:F-box protein At5g07610-like [Triticum aestivum]
MPLGGRCGGDHRYGEPATAHGDGDDENPSRSSPRPPLPLLPGLAVIPPASEKEQQKKQKHGQPAASFLEDILIDILSWVPYTSLCHFKCVSKEWLALCSDPDIRKRSPQTLSGFFYFDHGWKTLRPGWRFQNLSGKGAPMVDLDDLPFLGNTYKHFAVAQCSTSLLLCHAGDHALLGTAVGIIA